MKDMQGFKIRQAIEGSIQKALVKTAGECFAAPPQAVRRNITNFDEICFQAKQALESDSLDGTESRQLGQNRQSCRG